MEKIISDFIRNLYNKTKDYYYRHNTKLNEEHIETEICRTLSKKIKEKIDKSEIKQKLTKTYNIFLKINKPINTNMTVEEIKNELSQFDTLEKLIELMHSSLIKEVDILSFQEDFYQTLRNIDIDNEFDLSFDLQKLFKSGQNEILTSIKNELISDIELVFEECKIICEQNKKIRINLLNSKNNTDEKIDTPSNENNEEKKKEDFLKKREIQRRQDVLDREKQFQFRNYTFSNQTENFEETRKGGR